MKLSDTALIALGNAAARNDRLVPRRPQSPPIADLNVCRALEKGGLMEAVPFSAIGGDDVVTTEREGRRVCFRITNEGFAAINQTAPGDTPLVSATVVHPAPPAPVDAPAVLAAATVTDTIEAAAVAPIAAPSGKVNLHEAAQDVLNVWDNEGGGKIDMMDALENPMANLRSVLAGFVVTNSTRRAAGPKQSATKKERVLTMLRRAQGASAPEIAEATGWNNNTVRGFLAGLKKTGIGLESQRLPRPSGLPAERAEKSVTTYCISS